MEQPENFNLLGHVCEHVLTHTEKLSDGSDYQQWYCAKCGNTYYVVTELPKERP